MAILTLAEVKEQVVANEIAPYEEEIVKHLLTSDTVAYLENDEITNKVLSRTFLNRTLSEPGIEALEASLTAAGWTDVVVENQPSPAPVGIGRSNAQAGHQVFVSFKPAGSVTPPTPTPED